MNERACHRALVGAQFACSVGERVGFAASEDTDFADELAVPSVVVTPGNADGASPSQHSAAVCGDQNPRIVTH